MTKTALALVAVTLHTPFSRGKGIVDQAVFADAGETLVIGVDITAADAQGLIETGAAVDAAVDAAASPPIETPAATPRAKRIRPRRLAEGEKLAEGDPPVPIKSEPIDPPKPDEGGAEQ